MKLGILTFHSAHNYGATLQAYGLQEYLMNLGHEVFIIDYRPWYITNSYQKDHYTHWLSRRPKMCAIRLYHYVRYRKIRHRRWENFQTFITNKLNLFPYNVGMDFSEFDAIFIGSDQVWSPYHTGGNYDNVFFGSGFKCKTIAYAPSCSQSALSIEQMAKLRELLKDLTCISVREYSFQDLLQPLSSKQISVVVDPSILAGKKAYDKIAAPIIRKRPYVLVYEIIHHETVFQLAQRLANDLDADVVELTNGMLNFHRSTMDEGASPEEFLGYIKNAACVITTSFHGTAFSILFGTPFYTIRQHNDGDIRMLNILSQLGLQNRMVDSTDDINFSPLNQVFLDKALSSYCEWSQTYIHDALQ